MLLRTLVSKLDPKPSISSLPELEITGVCEDSRQIRPGELFVAKPGTKTHGTRFLADAHARGAVASIVESPEASCPLPQVVVRDARVAASVLANFYFGQPARQVRTLAVTGTNGKTTTTYLIREILRHVQVRCGLIGTVEIDDGRTRREANMTTPAATEVAALLAIMRDMGCRACAMEASSHALHQGRTAGVAFAGAAFTNLTGDHLDYHLTMEDYAAAKARLFESLEASAVAVVNGDSPWSDRMVRDCRARILRFGIGSTGDYRAQDVATSSEGTRFILHTPDGCAEVGTQLLGKHNIENALAAAALAGETFGLSVHQIAAGLSGAKGAPGRLQPVRVGQPFAVLVDYAHTDDALENVLSALRRVTRGKLRVLFGCGGDRDPSKRPRMAHAAEKYADAIYVTSDNPRSEPPGEIINQILVGFTPAARSGVAVEPDRRAAIQRIVADAHDDDVVLLAGKGHENYQIVGDEKRHFDDVEEATAALRAHRQLVNQPRPSA